MRQFKDENGRPWTINVNIGTVKRVRQMAGVDLLDLRDGNLFTELASDPVKLGDVLWVLVLDEAGAAGITDIQFAAALAGDALDSATQALLDEIVDFFPKPQRDLLRKALTKGKEMQERQMAKAMRQMEEAIEAWKPEEEVAPSGNLSGTAQAS
jgi:hypothetical protein